MSSNQSEDNNALRDNIDWKLNALLMADKQAKHYAPHATEGELIEQSFSPWMPKRLHNLDQKVQLGMQELASTNEVESHIEESEHLEQEQKVVLSEEEIKIEKLEECISGLEKKIKMLETERYEEGYTQGKLDTQHSLEAQYAMLDGLIGKLGDIQIDIKDYVDYVEKLAMELARRVLRQSALEVEPYRQLIREAMEMFEPVAQQELRLYVHPDAQKMLEGRLDDLGQKVSIFPDQHLDLGDLRLVFGYTEIEELINQKLEKAFDRLTQRG